MSPAALGIHGHGPHDGNPIARNSDVSFGGYADAPMFPSRDLSRHRCWWLAALLLAGGCGDPAPSGLVSSADVIESQRLAPPVLPEGTDLDPGVALVIEAALGKVREHPMDVGLRFELGMTFDANSLLEAASEAYEQTLQLDPRHARAHYHLAGKLRDLGRLKQAQASLERALELAPDYAAGHRRLGDWSTQAGELDAAERAFTRVSELQAEWPDGKLGLAHVALLREQPKRAAALAREVIAVHPQSTYAQHLLGSALRDLGQPAAAKEAFARAQGSVPLWRDPWLDEVEARLAGSSRLMVEAKACLAQGLYEEACERLTVLHAQDPDDVTVQGMWTAALTKLAKYDAALDLLLEARTRQPQHFRIELNLAIVRWKQGELDLAMQHLTRSVELNPTHEAVYMVQGQVLGERNDVKGAIGAFEKALSLGTDAQRVLPRIGRLQMALQEWGAAAEAYGRAVQAMPQDASMHATLAGCLVELGDLAGAKASLARARSIDPTEKLLGMIDARVAELNSGKQP